MNAINDNDKSFTIQPQPSTILQVMLETLPKFHFFKSLLVGGRLSFRCFGASTFGRVQSSICQAESSRSSEADDDCERTDLEESKYPFVERLDHYMERYPISEENRRSVELAIMVDAGSIVREMGTMTTTKAAATTTTTTMADTVDGMSRMR